MTSQHVCAPVVEVEDWNDAQYRLWCRTCGATGWALKVTTVEDTYRVRHICGQSPPFCLDYPPSKQSAPSAQERDQ